MTHTPGPWKSIYGHGGELGVREDGGFICFLTKPMRYSGQDERYEKEIEEYKANAHLIAAAPRMIKGLQRAEQTIRNIAANLPPDQDLATIAINEATNLRADITAAEGKE